MTGHLLQINLAAPHLRPYRRAMVRAEVEVMKMKLEDRGLRHLIVQDLVERTTLHLVRRDDVGWVELAQVREVGL